MTNANLFSDAQIAGMLMGPNARKITQDLCKLYCSAELKPGMRILDLGCGAGLSSMTLAEQYPVTIFAADIWISASENYSRFVKYGFEDRIVPIHTDANDLPFADEYFDMIVSVDSYHYFGREKGFFEEKFLPLLKPGGNFVISVPGFKEEYSPNYPKEMLLSWEADDLDTMHSINWWRELLASEKASIDQMTELPRFDEYWNDWLSCDNPHATVDRAAMNAWAGKYMNMIAITGRRI